MEEINDTVRHHTGVNIESVIVQVKRTRMCSNGRFSETNMNVREYWMPNGVSSRWQTYPLMYLILRNLPHFIIKLFTIDIS